MKKFIAALLFSACAFGVFAFGNDWKPITFSVFYLGAPINQAEIEKKDYGDFVLGSSISRADINDISVKAPNFGGFGFDLDVYLLKYIGVRLGMGFNFINDYTLPITLNDSAKAIKTDKRSFDDPACDFSIRIGLPLQFIVSSSFNVYFCPAFMMSFLKGESGAWYGNNDSDYFQETCKYNRYCFDIEAGLRLYLTSFLGIDIGADYSIGAGTLQRESTQGGTDKSNKSEVKNAMQFRFHAGVVLGL